MGPPRASRSDPRVAAILILVAVLLWVAIGSNVIGSAYRQDFLNLYTGGLLARSGHFADLYDFDVQAATQDRLVPGLTLRFPFVRPPFYALLLCPIALLPMDRAFPAWIALQVACMLIVGVWAWRRFGPDGAVFCAFFLPTSMGIANGQDCMVLLLVMLGAWSLLEKKKEGLAGLVLSLGLFKFHLFLLLPLAMLIRRRWILVGAYATGGAALAAVSLFLVGPAGIQGYFHLLTRKDVEALSISPEMMIGLNSIAVNAGLDFTWVKVLLFAAVIALVAWTARNAREELRWFWTAVIGSMMLSPHTYEYDVSSLLIPALLVSSSAYDRLSRIAARAALLPLAYFCTSAGSPWAIAPSIVVVVFLVLVSGAVPAGLISKSPQALPAAEG